VRDVCRSRALAQPQGPRIEIDAADVLLLADPDRLQQVVVNLVTNAQRYAGATGRVRVTLVVGERVVLGVEDDGPGVPRGHVARGSASAWCGSIPSRARATGRQRAGLGDRARDRERHRGQLLSRGLGRAACAPRFSSPATRAEPAGLPSGRGHPRGRRRGACSPHKGPPSVVAPNLCRCSIHVWRWSGNPAPRSSCGFAAPRASRGMPNGPFVTRGAQVSHRAPVGARRSGTEVEVLLRRAARRADGLDAVAVGPWRRGRRCSSLRFDWVGSSAVRCRSRAAPASVRVRQKSTPVGAWRRVAADTPGGEKREPAPKAVLGALAAAATRASCSASVQLLECTTRRSPESALAGLLMLTKNGRLVQVFADPPAACTWLAAEHHLDAGGLRAAYRRAVAGVRLPEATEAAGPPARARPPPSAAR
jgi:hypothetical protein